MKKYFLLSVILVSLVLGPAAILANSISATFQGGGVKFSYNAGYNHPKTIGEQIVILRKFFPQINYNYCHPGKGVIGAEGYFVIPRWQKIAATYEAAIEMVFEAIRKEQNIVLLDYRQTKIGKENFPMEIRNEIDARQCFDEFFARQNSDIMLVPCQFGRRHQGRSGHLTELNLADNEFGLDVYTVAVMLLTHANRLAKQYDLEVMCPGTRVGEDETWVPTFCLFFDQENGQRCIYFSPTAFQISPDANEGDSPDYISLRREECNHLGPVTAFVVSR